MHQKSQRLTPEILLTAYRRGFFPMAEPDGTIYWHYADPRAVFLPKKGMKISRSLRQTLRKQRYQIRFNTSFLAVISACADRPETWISEEIIRAYTELHNLGYAHSVETWYNDQLVGGLYGIAINGAFFGESMFTRMRDASKVALVALINHLRAQGFLLLDAQYPNSHTLSLGALILPATLFAPALAAALSRPTSFLPTPPPHFPSPPH